jgi:hypothetical protein
MQFDRNDAPSQDFYSLFKKATKGNVLYNTLNNRMGRHDYTVSWSGDGSNKSAAVICGEGLLALPALIWKRIESITHAYEEEFGSSYTEEEDSSNNGHSGLKRNRRATPRTAYHAISMISVGDPLD